MTSISSSFDSASSSSERERKRKGRFSVAGKIAIGFIGIGLLTTLISAYYSYSAAQKALHTSAISQMKSLRAVLQDSIESYFHTARCDLASMADSQTVWNALSDLREARRQLKAELKSQGIAIDPPLLDHIRQKVRHYYQHVLIRNLEKVSKVIKGTPETFMPPDDEALILQYFYTTDNPSAVGRKWDATDPADIAKFLSIDPTFRTAFSRTSYATKHPIYHRILTEHRKRFGYYDIFICDLEGYVVYTNFKELDFQGNLKKGAQASTGLGEAYRKALETSREPSPSDRVSVTDVAPYPISYNAPAIFMSCPILDKNRTVQGVLVYQLPTERINAVMTFHGRQREVGMGESGESYLFGPDFRARTNSRFMAALSDDQKRLDFLPDAISTAYTSIGLLKVDTLGARQALVGITDESLYPNYRGTQVLGAYTKLRIPGLNWGLVVEQDVRESFAPAQQLFTKVLLLGCLLVAVVGTVGLWFANRLSQPILELERTMRKVAVGDEKARATIQSNDELEDLAHTFNEMLAESRAVKSKIEKEHHLLQLNIQELLLVVSSASEGSLDVRARVAEGVLGNVADALNEMMNRFSDLISNTKRASDHMAGSASEISSASQDLSKATSAQSAQVARTTSHVQQHAAEALAILQNSRAAIGAAERARNAADHGARVVRELIVEMEKIHENVETNTKKVKRLGERSLEISGIVHAISDISIQTDMLALNAAMEASRAGEQGKGFVLLAENVRVLSDRAKALTVEIEKLVGLIQNEATEAVAHLEVQVQEVERGARKVTQAGQVLENVVQSSIQSYELVAQINHSSSEQAGRTQGILDSVSQIKSIAESSLNEVSIIRRSSEQLSRLSNELNEQLMRFRIPSR